MLVVSVKQEEEIDGLRESGMIFKRLIGLSEHHVQKVRGIAEVMLGIHERQSHFLAVGHGREGADLRDKEGCSIVKVFKILLPVV